MGIKPRRVPYPIRAARFLGLALPRVHPVEASNISRSKSEKLIIPNAKDYFLSREISLERFISFSCHANIAEEPVRITRPFRKPNERYELIILFF